MFSKDLCTSCRRFLTKLAASKILKYNCELIDDQNETFPDSPPPDAYSRKCSGCDKFFSSIGQVNFAGELNNKREIRPNCNDSNIEKGYYLDRAPTSLASTDRLITKDLHPNRLSQNPFDYVLGDSTAEAIENAHTAKEKHSTLATDHSIIAEPDSSDQMDNGSKSCASINVQENENDDSKFYNLRLLAQVCSELYEKDFLGGASSPEKRQKTESTSMSKDKFTNESSKRPSDDKMDPCGDDTIGRQISSPLIGKKVCLDQGNGTGKTKDQRVSSSKDCKSSKTKKADKLADNWERVGSDEIEVNIKSHYVIDKTKRRPYICKIDHDCHRYYNSADSVENHLTSHFDNLVCANRGRYFGASSRINQSKIQGFKGKSSDESIMKNAKRTFNVPDDMDSCKENEVKRRKQYWRSSL